MGLIQSIKLTDNIEDTRGLAGLDTPFFLIAKIQSKNYSNGDCIFFSFLVLGVH